MANAAHIWFLLIQLVFWGAVIALFDLGGPAFHPLPQLRHD